MKTQQAESMLRSLRSIRQAFRRQILEENRPKGLTFPQIAVLGVLAHAGPLSLGELSRRVELSNSTVSGIVDRLEKGGWVERRRDETDRRQVRISLSPQAEGLKDDIPKGQRDILLAALEDLPEGRCRRIADALQELSQALSRCLTDARRESRD